MESPHPNRVTYFPTATQGLFKRNEESIRGKPYEHYFNGDIWLHDEAMSAIAAPMDTRFALPVDTAGLNSLLDPGYHEVENGYCELPDGSAYVASLVPFPRCNGEMFKWWFWWHSVEAQRYTLWYPYNHIAASPVDRSVLYSDDLTHEQRYVGTTHLVDEYIGAKRVKVSIQFVDPAELGFDTTRFPEAGIVGHG